MMMMTRRSYSDPRDAHPTCQILPKLIDLSWVKIFKNLTFFSINASEASQVCFQIKYTVVHLFNAHLLINAHGFRLNKNWY